MLRKSLVLALTVSFAVPVGARDYYYFHKARVTRDAYKADRVECERLMGGARAPDRAPVYVANNTLTPSQNAAVIGIVSLFEGMMNARQRRRTASAVERTCMADKGYGRFSVPDALAREIQDLPEPEARLDRYFAMAGADQPTGERMVE